MTTSNTLCKFSATRLLIVNYLNYLLSMKDSTESWDYLCQLQSTFYISETHFLEFLPEAIFLFGLLFLLIFSVFLRVTYTRRVTTLVVYVYTVMLLTLVFILFLLCGSSNGSYLFNFSLITDFYTQSLKLIVLSFALLLLMVSKNFLLRSIKKDIIEYLLLLCFSLFMMFILISSINIITTFIALEGLTIIIYILSIFPFVRYNFEATIKYFYLSALASSILLYSSSLIYGLTGSLNFIMIKYYIYRDFLLEPTNLSLQVIVISLIFSMLFKIGAFPLHWWVPDIYESAWLFSTAFFMIITKLVFFCFFSRMLLYFFFSFILIWQPLLIFSVLGSVTIGAFGALMQTKIKRLFAYTSIAQIGFALLGISTGSVSGVISSIFFLLTYLFTTIILFITLLNTESFFYNRPLIYISDFKGLSKSSYNSPWDLLKLTLVILSMAGIPPLAGFWGKYLIFLEAIRGSFYCVTLLCILASVINSYVYIKLVKNIWFDDINFFTETIPFYDIYIMSPSAVPFLDVVHTLLVMILTFFFFFLPIFFEFSTCFVLSFLFLT